MSYLNQVCGPMKVLDHLIGGAAFVISQVEGQTFNLNTQKIVKSSGGQVYATFSAIMGQAPRFNGMTEAIAQFITGIGFEGKELTLGLELYNQLVDVTTGKRAAGAVHEKLAFTKALVVPRQLSCAHKQIARISFDVFGVSSDGLVHPCAMTENVALPAITGVAEQFTLGPISIDGATYEGIQDLTIDFGLTEMLKSSGRDVYTKLAYLSEIKPKITIRSDDSAVLSALGLTGTNNATPSVIFLAKVLKNAVRVADGTAEHISITINDGMWIPDEKGGQHPGALTTGFECEVTYDGVNAPLVVSAAAVIA